MRSLIWIVYSFFDWVGIKRSSIWFQINWLNIIYLNVLAVCDYGNCEIFWWLANYIYMEDSLRSHLITRERGLPCIIKACRVRFVAAVSALNIMAPGLSGARNFFFIRFSVATLCRFVARFARVRIEDSNFNRFASRSTALKKLSASLFFLHYSKK